MKGQVLSENIFSHHPYTLQLISSFLYHYKDQITYDACVLPERISYDENEKGKCPYIEKCKLYNILKDKNKELSQKCDTYIPVLRKIEGSFPCQEVACHFSHFIQKEKITQSSVVYQEKQDRYFGQKLIEGKNITVSYGTQQILKDISLTIFQNRHLGIVGETGSGKSTLARTLAMIPAQNQKTSGSLSWSYQNQWRNPEELSIHERKIYRNCNQMIWQQPSDVFPQCENIEISLLDACKTWSKIFHIHENKSLMYERIKSILLELNLLEELSFYEFLNKNPENLSGGQRKRLLLARSLLACGYPEATHEYPRILYIDEPLRGIDVINKSSILRCIQKSSKVLNATLIMITHDFRVVNFLCEDVIILYHGYILQQGPVREIITPAIAMKGDLEKHHPYTRDLIGSIPHIDSFWEDESFELSSRETEKGCIYRHFCKKYQSAKKDSYSITKRCEEEQPLLKNITSHMKVACHMVE